MTTTDEIAKLKADAAALKKQLDSLHRSASDMLAVCQKLTASLAMLQNGVDLLIDPKRHHN